MVWIRSGFLDLEHAVPVVPARARVEADRRRPGLTRLLDRRLGLALAAGHCLLIFLKKPQAGPFSSRYNRKPTAIHHPWLRLKILLLLK